MGELVKKASCLTVNFPIELWALNLWLRDKPGSRLSELVGREELHRRTTEASSGKGQRLHFPARFSDDRDLRNRVSVRENKIQIVPIRAAFPVLCLLYTSDAADE